MEIRTATIELVNVDFNDRLEFYVDLKLSCETNSFEVLKFVFGHASEEVQLKKLKEYTLSEEVDDLKGKTIRTVHVGDTLVGFGANESADEKAFVPIFTATFQEVSKTGFEEILKKLDAFMREPF